MNASRIFTLTLVAASLSAAACSVGAQDAATSRVLVRAEVLQARNDRTLIPAGEGLLSRSTMPTESTAMASSVSRREVRAEFMQARADDELVPAGEGIMADEPTVSMLARAEVRESVREARMRGELTPAGEGLGPVERTARTTGPRRGAYAAMARR